MTTMSLHGSSLSLSFVALKKEKKDNKNPPRLAIASEGVGCHRCRGCRRRQMTTASLHGLSLSLSFVDLKKRRKKTHSVSQLQARGWVRVGRKKVETHPGLQLHARGRAFVILCCAVIVSNQQCIMRNTYLAHRH